MFGPYQSPWGPVYMGDPGAPHLNQSQPSHSTFGWLLLILLSILYIAGATCGITQLTGIPFFLASVVAGVLYLMKMFFLRRQLWYERFTSNGWDKIVGYVATAIVFTMLNAYGLYGIGMMLNGPPTRSPTLKAGGALAIQPRKPLNSPLAKDEGAVLNVGEEKEPESADLLIADDPETEYREDRPPWWNNQLGKRRPVRRSLNNNRPDMRRLSGSPIGITGIEPLVEADKDFVVVPPMRLLSIEDQNENESLMPQPEALKPLVTFESFVNDTLSQSNHALGCWLLALILEGFIVMLVVYNRQ